MAFRSRAMNSQGSAVYIQDDDATTSAITITGITAANPGVVTSTAHGRLEGDVGTFAAIGGMTQLNGTTGIVANPTANTFEIGNTTGFTAYTSGGTFTPVGWLQACEIRNFSLTGGQSPEIDISTVCSVSSEYLLGLGDPGEASMDVNFVPGDPAIAEFMEANLDGQPRWFKIVMPGGTGSIVFQASVRQISWAFGVNQAWQGTISLRITGLVSFVGVEALPIAA